MKSIKAIFRRGGGHKEGSNHQDNVSRTSSTTNLESFDALKGAKPKKTPSKERIEKQSQDGKKAKNNNKLEPTVPNPALSYLTDTLQESELLQLRKQLREMADAKSSLALQLGEQRGHLSALQSEILKLKNFQEESNMEMEKLVEENTTLRNRLRDVAHSPLSDNEKQQLLFDNRHHNSAPASISTNVLEEHNGDMTACTTSDWDKHSSGNVSEVSVACLQDKINQMQETHYSTNEELQATLQELTDLQRQLTELQQENERLNEEKTLMFDSLCRQTERLTDSRQEVESLKELLYRERSDDNDSTQFENAVEREQKLVELLRNAQEEREQLLIKLDQVQAELQDTRAATTDRNETINQLSERVRTLECTLDAKHAEHKQLDQELAQAKDQCSGKQIEIDRLTDLLENARTKINELEQDRALSDKSELDEMLDSARKEKDQLESEITYLKEQLARSKNETEKLKEQVFVLQEECKVTRNNAKTTHADLEYKLEKMMSEKTALNEQLQHFQEAVNELQVQVQCHLEDKRQLSSVLSETQRNMSEAEGKNLTLEHELEELKKLRAEENDEWEKFQNDLLTSVRVANDFKTEAQQELQNIILENKSYREKVRLLEGQVEKLKGPDSWKDISTQTEVILTPQIVTLAKNVDPAITSKISYLEHSPDTGIHTNPSTGMEKLFPILTKERKSKSKEVLAEPSRSKENLTDITSFSSSSLQKNNSGEKQNFLKDGKTKVDVTEIDTSKAESKDDSSSEGKRGLFRRSKSKENVTDFTEDSKEKGSRGFLKWNKNKDNLQAPDENSKSRLKKSKSRENLDQIESEEKPEFLKFIKKREKKTGSRTKLDSHPKFMSVEEEMLLKSLNNWYENIDQNLPDEFLSEEDRAVKRLKTLFEDENLKEKPVAHKPKENLAISKPLLQSVVKNPKLEKIFRDPRLPTVDGEMRQSALEDVCSVVNSEPKHNLTVKDIPVREFSVPTILYRASTDIQPSDSVSNPRHSGKYELPKPNIYINYENLDQIIAAIPQGLSESKLTEEQKFALKLKKALDDAEKETTLRKKKNKPSFRDMDISAPTKESVEKNWKLKEIMLNPQIKRAEPIKRRSSWRHSTDISSLGSPRVNPKQEGLSSKSYEDISFSFIPENTLLNLYYKDAIESSKFYSDVSSGSPSCYTSAEFNLDTGEIFRKYNASNTFDDNEDLLYNATVNKAKKQNRKSKEVIQKLITELSKQEEVEDEIVHHPKIMDARERYRKELQMALRQLEEDELRSSLRKKRLIHDEDPMEIKEQFEVRLLETSQFQTADIVEERNVYEVKIEEGDEKALARRNEFIVKIVESDRIFSLPIVIEKKVHVLDLEEHDKDDTISPKINNPTQNTEKQFRDENFNLKEVSEEAKVVEIDAPMREVLLENVEDQKPEVTHSKNPDEPNEIVEHFSENMNTTNNTKNNVGTEPLHADQLIEKADSLSGQIENNRPMQDIHEPIMDNIETLKSDDHIPHSIQEEQIKYFEEPVTYACKTENATSFHVPYENENTEQPNRQEETSVISDDVITYDVVMEDEPSNYNENNDINVIVSEYPNEIEDANPNLTLKENRYGVISPPEVRGTYRTLVKEYKTKYPQDNLELTEEDVKDSESLLSSSDGDFIDEFFQPVKGWKNMEELEDKSNKMSQIDKEMDEIMDRYLYSQSSLLLNKNQNDPEPSNLKKYNNFENLQDIETSKMSVEVPTELLSFEDMELIEEMKQRYASADTISISSSQSFTDDQEDPYIRRNKNTTRPLSNINDQDLELIERISQMNDNEPPPPLPATPPPATKSQVKELPPSLRPRTFVETSNVVMRTRPTTRSPTTSKRLSEMMFKETIFVPHDTIPIGYPQIGDEQTIFASKNEGEPLSRVSVNLNRYSFESKNPWSDNLKRDVLEPIKDSYRPVYANERVPLNKPLPRPRVAYLEPVDNDKSNIMTEIQANSSEVHQDTATTVEEISVGHSKAHTDISQTVKLPRETGESLPMRQEDLTFEEEKKVEGMSDPIPEKDIEEVQTVSSDLEDSNVNLFHISSQPSYDSYLELFKTKESKEFDHLQGKKPHSKGFFYRDFKYVDEADSTQGEEASSEAQAIPKIIDFVPLDEKTTPVFTKEPSEGITRDTLEREKTFHVLEQAVQLGKPHQQTEQEASIELLARKSSSNFSKNSSQTEISRTSFTQAKKLFEALTEANKTTDRPGSVLEPKTIPFAKFQEKKSKSFDKLKKKEDEEPK
ncbi:hypothetical protein ABEB36_014307 [Hypothenemus hampei]|uniref:Uncharacterized protein n=1 Tax=Hypothenemus hampei TaxID=57062 RepID=A0ABD1E651_HYPHA